MDTAAGLAAGAEIDAGSQQIADLARRLENVLHSFEWSGPDAEDTLDTWGSSTRPSLDATSTHLAALAALLRKEAEAQDTASGEAGAGSSAGASIDSAAATSWLGRLGGAITDRLSAAYAGLQRYLGNTGDYFSKVFDVLTGKENWSVAEIAGAYIAATGAGAGVVANAITGVDQHIFDDRPGTVGTPTPAGGAHPLVPPTDLPSVMAGVTSAYGVGESTGVGDIRVTRIDNGTGPPTYIVATPGTETWSPTAGSQPHDLTANVALVAGHPSAAADTIQQAIEKAGVPPGAKILAVGHSQAGIGIATLASNPDFAKKYDVTVLTYGAPIDHLQLAPGVHALQMQHQDDLVPKLDLGGYGAGMAAWPNTHVPEVVLPSPGEGLKVNHDYKLYAESVRHELSANTPGGQRLRDFQASLAPFLVKPGGTSSAVDVPVRRGP